ncbi:MAG: carbohydrate ABC transporter permease [bacterium]
MSLSYYAKKRIVNISINIVMLLFLFLTLLPIGWMVYSSLKDSTDIAIGKVGLRRAGKDILKIIPEGEKLLVLSADGGIYHYRTKDLKRLAKANHKTAASSYLVDDQNIWLASANKGLFQIDRQDISKFRRYKFDTSGIETHKVTTSYMKAENGKILITLDFKKFNDVWQFDTATKEFKQLSRAKRRYFGNVRRVVPEEFPGVNGEVFARAERYGFLYLGTSSGRLYKYDLKTKEMAGETRLPRGHLLVRWYNYVDMWKNVNFGLYLRNSLIICGFTMLFAMIFATFAAYALSRFRFPGSDLFSNAILATQMIPMIMYLIPIYIMFVKFSMLTNIQVKGTFPGLILIYSAWFLPFSIWILRGFFAAIPRELEEAALIDGCSRLRVFWHIALPLAIPGIIATGIYVFLTAWDELMFAWVLTNADTMTIPVGIRLFVGNYQNRFDLMMAAATVATLPVVVLFFLLQKHIVKGLTAGAVKG